MRLSNIRDTEPLHRARRLGSHSALRLLRATLDYSHLLVVTALQLLVFTSSITAKQLLCSSCQGFPLIAQSYRHCASVNGNYHSHLAIVPQLLLFPSSIVSQSYIYRFPAVAISILCHCYLAIMLHLFVHLLIRLFQSLLFNSVVLDIPALHYQLTFLHHHKPETS